VIRPSGSSLRESEAVLRFASLRCETQTMSFYHSDDDTFFPDFDSLIRLLSSFDSNEDKLIGTLSESTKQVSSSLRIAIP